LETDLIYDVGLHNGDDTAFYLSRGYRVVAVEADPRLAKQARVRFEREIRQGRLTVLNVAVGPKEGLVQFWICDLVSQWSSLDRAVASRMGMSHHPIDVYSRPFSDILREHGIPYYLKVDIEHYDRYCVEAIDAADRPAYLSIEFNEIEDLIALNRLGYSAFKIIYQTKAFRHTQFHSELWTPPMPQRRTRQHGGLAVPTTVTTPPGPSGPFGEETDGQWESFEQTAYQLLSFVLGHSQHGYPPEWTIWFDIHAATNGLPPRAYATDRTRASRNSLH
jgi:FkbM family methyltransferase